MWINFFIAKTPKAFEDKSEKHSFSNLIVFYEICQLTLEMKQLYSLEVDKYLNQKVKGVITQMYKYFPVTI